MPPKPDFVFNNAPNDVETDHLALTVKLTLTKPDQDLSLTNRPSTPIIKDWVSDSEDESKTKTPQHVLSFVQTTEQVKSLRHFVQHDETSIPPKTAIPKPTSNGKRMNRKACFVTRSRHAKPIVTKPNSPTRRHTNRSPSPRVSNSPPRVTAVKAPIVNVAQGNMSYLFDFEELSGGYFAFGGNPKGGKISGKGKFDGKVDEGFLVGYSVNNKVFRVFNSLTRIVQETLHVNFLENKPNVAGSGPTWLFDIDSLTRTMNYQLVSAGNQTNPCAGFQDQFAVEKAGEEVNQQYPDFDAKKPESEVIVSPSSSAQLRKQDDKTKKEAKGKSHVESFTRYRDLSVEFEDCFDNSINEVNAADTIILTVGQNSLDSTNTFSAAELEDITYSDDEDDVGAEADFNNLETSISVSPIPRSRVHKDHLVTQIIGSGPTWLFDIDSLTKTINYQPVTIDAAFYENEPEFDEKKPESEVNVSLSSSAQSKKQDDKTKREAKGKSPVKSFIGYRKLSAEFEDFSENSINEDFLLLESEDITYSNDENYVGTEVDFNNLEISITVSPIPTARVHKDHPMTQIIGDLSSATETRSMKRVAKDQDHVKKKAKEDPTVKRYQDLKRKPQTEAQAKKNTMIYLKNVACFKMDYFKGMSYDDIRPNFEVKFKSNMAFLQNTKEQIKEEESRALKRINETPVEKATTTPLARKVPIVADIAKADQDAKVDDSVDIQGRQAESQAKIYKNYLDHANKVLSMQEEESEPTEVQEVVDVDTAAKLITEVVTAASTTITAAEVLVPATTTAVAASTLTAAPSRRTKGVVIRDLEESTTTTSIIIHTEAKSKDKGEGILVEEPKPLKKQAQIEQDGFWTTVAVKKVNHVTRLQSLVDKKKVLITEATIRDALCLNDAEAQEVGSGVADEVHDEGVYAAGVATEGDVRLRNWRGEIRGRMIAKMNQDADVVLEEAKEVDDIVKADQDAKVHECVDIQGRQAESQAKIYKINLDHAYKLITKVVNVASTTITAAKVSVPAAIKTIVAFTLTAAPSRRTKERDLEVSTTTTSTIIHTKAKSKDKGKGILVDEPKPLKKQAQIKQDEQYAKELKVELNKNIDWDKVIDHVKRRLKKILL
nr:retrovirus-related Pol polyprotein from transposon TNT 1-94 [Tanacetum cinerariifolium]